MGQRANATALRLFNKKIVKTGNLWFTNNKDVYSQYIHDDMILSDYIKNVFKHKNFEVLDINIKLN